MDIPCLGTRTQRRPGQAHPGHNVGLIQRRGVLRPNEGTSSMSGSTAPGWCPAGRSAPTGLPMRLAFKELNPARWIGGFEGTHDDGDLAAVYELWPRSVGAG
jgi:hypothetical protein